MCFYLVLYYYVITFFGAHFYHWDIFAITFANIVYIVDFMANALSKPVPIIGFV